MKIEHVTIHNFTSPDTFWGKVKALPAEEQINATITGTFSWNEYKQLVLDASTGNGCDLNDLEES